MRFQPRFCPRSDCPARFGTGFRFQHAGVYRRRCDRRTVLRFQCLVCRRGFSSQTFRLDYRLKRPELLVALFVQRISKVTHRQSARTLVCSRSTEERHFHRLGDHCRDFHRVCLARVGARGGLGERFLLDELETYEQHRMKQPVTVPVLIERHSGFVLDLQAGSMGARGKRQPGATRRWESSELVRRALSRLRAFAPKDERLVLDTDEKSSYPRIVRELFGARCRQRRTHSTERRDGKNPLCPVNHTCARLRDGVSSLVRETWAASKKKERLAERLAIWACYRNYVRGKTNREPRTTPAMALGVVGRRFSPRRLLERRVFMTR